MPDIREKKKINLGPVRESECPNCHGHDIDWETNLEDEWIFYRGYCNDCQLTFTNDYSLSFVGVTLDIVYKGDDGKTHYDTRTFDASQEMILEEGEEPDAKDYQHND